MENTFYQFFSIFFCRSARMINKFIFIAFWYETNFQNMLCSMCAHFGSFVWKKKKILLVVGAGLFFHLLFFFYLFLFSLFFNILVHDLTFQIASKILTVEKVFVKWASVWKFCRMSKCGWPVGRGLKSWGV